MARNASNKAIVAGAKDRSTNKVSASRIEKADNETSLGFVAGHADKEAVAYTDDRRGYKELPFKHEAVIT